MIVVTGDKYCVMVRRLQFRVEKLGRILAFRIVEETVAERVEWRTEGKDSKKKRNSLKFYVKARAGKFPRAASHHVDLVKDYLLEEGVSPWFMIREELPRLLNRLWYFFNLNVGVS